VDQKAHSFALRKVSKMPSCRNCVHSRHLTHSLIHSKLEFYLECTRKCVWDLVEESPGIKKLKIVSGHAVPCFTERRITGKHKCGYKGKYFEERSKKVAENRIENQVESEEVV